MAMYAEIQDVLQDWKVLRKSELEEQYFNVTAVRLMWGTVDKYTARLLPRTGRHTLTVFAADWVVTNTHAESGSRSTERDARAEQLQYLSRRHENEDEADKIHLLAGDFNARPFEDEC